GAQELVHEPIHVAVGRHAPYHSTRPPTARRGTGSICVARSPQPSPRSRAAQLELPRCERAGSPQRGSLTLARVSISAHLAYGCGSPNLTYASGCQGARYLVWLATCPSARGALLCCGPWPISPMSFPGPAHATTSFRSAAGAI